MDMSFPESAWVQVQTPLAEADLLRLSATDLRFEVIDGTVHEMSSVGVLHSVVAGNVYRSLFDYAATQSLGYVFSDSLIYVLREDADMQIRDTRIPDISFVRKGRMPKRPNHARPFAGAPDLAVEVVSPGESAETLADKVADYFTYGSEQVWVLYSSTRQLHQYTHGQNTIRVYREAETLSLETLLPGFSARIGDFFVYPEDDDDNSPTDE